jgi:cyclophilin family peptidyl-prolyl cis-trans isomerase
MKNFRLISVLLFVLFCLSGHSQKVTPDPGDYLVTITTSFGNIKILLFDDTPVHKQNFITLAESGFYNYTSFHRIINGFMIQAGEDTTAYASGKTFEEVSLPAEFRPNRVHKRGAVSMARPENPEKRSDRTQFFIVQSYNGAHFLDNQYTVFGQVVSGLEVVDNIALVEKDLTDRPVYPMRITVKVDKVKRSDVLKFYSWVYE